MLLGLAALVLAAPAGGAGRGGTVHALLTDNTLVRVSESGQVLSRTRLGRASGDFPSFGGLLASSPFSDIYMRAQDPSLVVVDVEAGRIVRSVRLPDEPADVLAVG